MTTAVERGEWSAARPGRTLPPGKPRYPLYRRLGGPQGRSGRAENLVATGIRSRTVQPVAQSVYRQSYPAHTYTHTYKTIIIIIIIIIIQSKYNRSCPLLGTKNEYWCVGLYTINAQDVRITRQYAFSDNAQFGNVSRRASSSPRKGSISFAVSFCMSVRVQYLGLPLDRFIMRLHI